MLRVSERQWRERAVAEEEGGGGGEEDREAEVKRELFNPPKD